MSEDTEDQWLYGDSGTDVGEKEGEETSRDSLRMDLSMDDVEPSGGEGSGAETAGAKEEGERASPPASQAQNVSNDAAQDAKNNGETRDDQPEGESAANDVEDDEVLKDAPTPSMDENPEPMVDGAEAVTPERTEGTTEPAAEGAGNGVAADATNPDAVDDDEDDDSDDDVQVVIGDIKTSPTYSSINLVKRGMLAPTSSTADKGKGKFSVDDFEAMGSINGVPAHEFNLDSLEDKPWRKPGADITDYFNYGFNEDTWRAYCERQKRMRVFESGVGLGAAGGISKPFASQGTIPVTIVNDNSKYSGIMGPKKAGPPPGRKLAGTIDVIGGSTVTSRRGMDTAKPALGPKENVIQVMTADKREYSRKPFPDMTVPPPTLGQFDMPPPPAGVIPPVGQFPHMVVESFGGNDYYNPESDPYYQSYEPTQESQWGPDPYSGGGGGRGMLRDLNEDRERAERARARERERERDGDVGHQIPLPPAGAMMEKEGRERSKDRQDRDRDQERQDRHRSRHRRSRSHSSDRRKSKHRSRSRSPSHRHKRKKSKQERKEKEGSE